MTTSAQLRAQAEDTEVEVVPGLGAGIMRFTVGGRNVLRPARGNPDDPYDRSLFVMAPWVNRIGHGRFFSGEEFVSLRGNVAGEPHPIHGEAWLGVWEVEDAGDRRIELRFAGDSSGWPWPYSVDYAVAVEPGRLDLHLRLTNLADTAMPASIGFHPYFERPARLTATVDGVWEIGPDRLPVRWEPRHGFRSTDIDGIITDESYTGWDGRAVIENHDLRIDLWSNLDTLHVYAPRGQHLFCAEPASAAPDAVNNEGRGLRMLAPGTALAATMRLLVEGR